MSGSDPALRATMNSLAIANCIVVFYSFLQECFMYQGFTLFYTVYENKDLYAKEFQIYRSVDIDFNCFKNRNAEKKKRFS